jgi:hypothetical protein
MLLKYFNSNRPSVLLLGPFVTLALWFHTIVHSQELVFSENLSAGPFGRFFISLINEVPVLSVIITLILILLYGHLLVNLNVKYFFIETRSQVPQLLFIVISGILAPLRYFSPALAAVFFVILIIYRLFNTYKSDKLSLNFFDAGFLLAIATLIYLPSVFFFPVILLVLFYFRSSSWQEWIYPFVGFFIPMIFWASYLFWTDREISLIFQEFSGLFQQSAGKQTYSLIQLIFFAYLGLLIIIGSIHTIFIIDSRKIQSRVFLIFFFWFFIVSVILLYAIPSSGAEAVYFTGIPVVYLLSNYFHTCRNTRMNNILLGLIIIFIAVVIANDWADVIPLSYSF